MELTGILTVPGRWGVGLFNLERTCFGRPVRPWVTRPALGEPAFLCVILSSRLSSSFTLSGYFGARLFFSPMSSFWWYSCGYEALPVSIPTASISAGPGWGRIYFQSPSTMAVGSAKPCSTRTCRPVSDVPRNVCRWSSLSVAYFERYLAPEPFSFSAISADPDDKRYGLTVR